MKTIATTLGVARSHLHNRLRRSDEPHPKSRKAEDAVVLQHIRRLVEQRPTYGYRRITALLRRELAHENSPPINHKRVFRIMRQQGLLLARHGRIAESGSSEHVFGSNGSARALNIDQSCSTAPPLPTGAGAGAGGRRDRLDADRYPAARRVFSERHGSHFMHAVDAVCSWGMS